MTVLGLINCWYAASSFPMMVLMMILILSDILCWEKILQKEAKTLWYECVGMVGVSATCCFMNVSDGFPLWERTEAQSNPYLYYTTKIYLQMTSNTCLKTTKQRSIKQSLKTRLTDCTEVVSSMWFWRSLAMWRHE